MSKFTINVTPSYLRRLSDIEDFIYESSGSSIVAVEKFLNEHDRVLRFIKENISTPALHPEVGHQSWPFGEGRYRLFYKAVGNEIFLLDLIDNRMSNLNVYPNNKISTYREE